MNKEDEPRRCVGGYVLIVRSLEVYRYRKGFGVVLVESWSWIAPNLPKQTGKERKNDVEDNNEKRRSIGASLYFLQ
jgi:hypothetical protein